jgi:hypothetical protein
MRPGRRWDRNDGEDRDGEAESHFR